MRIKRTNPPHGIARRTRLLAMTTGLVAAAALAVPAASADEAPATFSATQLSAASDAVLDADVAGTAWHIDKATEHPGRHRRLHRLPGRDRADQAGGRRQRRRDPRSSAPPASSPSSISGGDAIYAEQLALLARLQRPQQRRHALLPDRRPLHRRRGHLVVQLRPHHGPRHHGRAPASRRNDYGIVRYTNTSVAKPGTVGSVGHHQRGQRHRRHVRHPSRLHHRHPQRPGHRPQRHGQLRRRRHRLRHDPHQRLRRAGRQRRPALLRQPAPSA